MDMYERGRNMSGQEAIDRVREYLRLAHVSLNSIPMEESEQMMTYRSFNRILMRVEEEIKDERDKDNL